MSFSTCAARGRFHRWLVVGLVSLCSLVGSAVHAASPWEPARVVSRGDIVLAMRAQQAQGYALDAIANAVRLQVGVFLHVADSARAADAKQLPLRIGHEAYRAAYMEVTGLAIDRLPSFVRVPFEYKEDYLLDYRMDRVFDVASGGVAPLRALNVKAGWPDTPGSPQSYSFEDRSTDPAVEVTHERVTAYRILDYGSMIVYDDIRGITGRAISGLLGSIFSVVGKAQAVQTRFAVAPDGTQVSRSTARKGLTLSQSVTIERGGRVITGIPDERPDLDLIDKQLQRHEVNVRYQPLDMSPMPL